MCYICTNISIIYYQEEKYIQLIFVNQLKIKLKRLQIVLTYYKNLIKI